ncbi:MAG: acireductone synthase [Cyanobacteria bacterium]|nr:acireductone synthase [Cyanobacteria bacterium CG_2015-16_32_12]NCO77170.1 acireductone synthase [Cyanobacteria bacterium CG_2015-22_32_23]NCQ04373.1 acireductone synthase [Cyanobacteria bacterium CG_2015-09_32_10]NCQ41011.1 acireductone synthase [Cyanobacteria bacterium CG_2015-04_32_10]
MIKAIVTDIEGTTSSISFVHDVLFPYAYDKMADFLIKNWDNSSIKNIILEVAKLENLTNYNQQKIISILRDWIKNDLKITPLKDIQGMIWEEGYKNGDYQSHVYEDAYQKLSFWHSQNIPIYIYSSGSCSAQKLFFKHSQYGNLLNLFTGFFDTNIGGKKEANSYKNIANNIGLNTEEIIFLSDIEAEVNSAFSVGMKTVWIIRDESIFNEKKNSNYPHQITNNFHLIKI